VGAARPHRPHPLGSPNGTRRRAGGALGALLLLVLGFGWITWVALLGGLVMALIYSVAYFDQSAERRLVKHGYPPGTAQQTVSAHDRTKDPDRMRRYMQTYRNNALEGPAAGPQSRSHDNHAS
jgi:hypothetical protein